MTDKQIIKLNEITEMSQELGLYDDRPDWRITLQADHIKRLEEQLDQLKTDNRILKEKFEIAIKNNMDKTLLRLENGDVKEELQEIREEFGIETLYCHDDNTRVHRCIKLLQLKDCLTEIKDFLEYEFCGENIWVKETILQKISEVEDEN